MLYIVEVRRIGISLAVSMAEMRTWFDHHRIDPAEFDHSSGGPGITFRIAFHSEAAALAFARAFHGRFNNGVDPNGAAFWPATDPPP
jgi:hypothetical protein